MLRLLKAVLGVAEESWTRTVKLNVPVGAGKPLKTPPFERLSPPGSDPEEISQESGPVPPVVARV
jgi:hypothetical protein